MGDWIAERVFWGAFSVGVLVIMALFGVAADAMLDYGIVRELSLIGLVKLIGLGAIVAAGVGAGLIGIGAVVCVFTERL